MQPVVIVLIVVLLIVPIFFYVKPHLSGGLMTHVYGRELRDLIDPSGANARAADAAKRKAMLERLGEARTKTGSSRLTTEKKLKYAEWRISPMVIYLSSTALSLLFLKLVYSSTGAIIHVCALIMGPVVVIGILNMAVDRRSSKFDADYPQFLLSVVGLLKTGMAPVNAIEAAAAGLDRKSLVRSEVTFMVERMRLGLPEERAIGAFGETINHPEIELFIQALLLSRRVGGGLSDTLERLAKQTRKRQFFRSSANAAVALQRASGWLIIVILFLVEIYVYFMAPALIVDGWADPTGWLVWQSAFVAILTSIVWSREVTKIKI